MRRRIREESSTDKMNNAIQNIILQEMETLDGIMIATTNLTENFDLCNAESIRKEATSKRIGF